MLEGDQTKAACVNQPTYRSEMQHEGILLNVSRDDPETNPAADVQ